MSKMWLYNPETKLLYRILEIKRDKLTTSSEPDILGGHRHTLGSGRTVTSMCAGATDGGTRDALTEKDRASITLTLPEVSPRSLGMLIALYERTTGLYASLVGINASTMRMLDIFLLHCLLTDSPNDTPGELAAISRNQERVADEGQQNHAAEAEQHVMTTSPRPRHSADDALARLASTASHTVESGKKLLFCFGLQPSAAASADEDSSDGDEDRDSDSE